MLKLIISRYPYFFERCMVNILQSGEDVWYISNAFVYLKYLSILSIILSTLNIILIDS